MIQLRKIFYSSFFLLILGLIGASLYCYYFFQFWTHVDTSQFTVLTEYNGNNVKGFRWRQVLIHKDFLPFARQVDKSAQSNDLTAIIMQGFRSHDAKISNTVVTPATKSNHLAGHALDLNIRYQDRTYVSTDLKKGNLPQLPEAIEYFIQSIQENKTLRWGGDFYHEDPVHIDDGLNKRDLNRWTAHYHSSQKEYAQALPKWKSWLRSLSPWQFL